MSALKAFFLIFVAVVFLGCAATKDRKAVSRVIGKDVLFNQVGNRWQQAHPCTIDTLIQFKEGKVVVSYDTVYLPDISYDTLNHVEYRTKLVTVTKVIHDTSRIYVTDSRALNTAINNNQLLQGKYDQQKIEKEAINKTSNKKTWWLAGAGIAILLLGYVIFRLLVFKKK